MAINTTLTANLTNPYKIWVAANGLSEGWFSMMFIAVMGLILLVTWKQFDTKASTLVMLFMMSIVSILFWLAGLVGANVIFIVMGLLFGAFILNALFK